MKLRFATVEDIPQIIALERECERAAHWSEDRYRQVFQAAARAESLALVIEAVAVEGPGCGLLGFLIATQVRPECELENVGVASAARRLGIGKRLIEAWIARAREAHTNALFLEVRESNVAARRLYEKTGFQQFGRRKSYYANPTEDAVLYRQSLA